MRWHVRLMLLCTIAVFAAGCTDSDRPTEPATQANGTGPNFTDLPPGTACMGDLIWEDLNCNGVQDAGEPGLGGVTVRLYECPSNVLVDETTTDGTGYYALFGPAPDDYYIIVELPEGCSFSPKDVGQPTSSDIGTDSDVDVNGKGFCTHLGDLEIEKEMDAGVCCPGVPCSSSIGDRVWFDTNCDGIQDAGEVSGPQGVDVSLYNCATGGLVGSTTTDASGYYLFAGVPAGEYKVCFDLPDGFEWTLKDVGADGFDSDAGADGCTDCFVLECDKPNMTKDAGLCEKKEEGGEGCTPGFWRNHLEHWAATPYDPSMVVNTVFGCNLAPAGVTLGQAIDAPQTYGVLVFHAIAALLNASHPDVDYAFTVGEVIALACDGDKDALADENEAGCPLSGDNTTGGGGPTSSSLKLK